MPKSFEEINSINNNSERLLLLRRRLDKTQYQFAQDIGVSESYLGQVESGKFPVTKQLIKKINVFIEKENRMNEEDLFRDFRL